MKYKADYSKKMTFHQVLSSFNSDKKYISYSTQKNIDKEKLFESRIISFNIFGEIFIDGKHDDTGRYQELIKLDWFEVHEVKEEPKKDPIDTNRSIPKEIITPVVSTLVIDGVNITEAVRQICREEIAKQIKDNYYNMASLGAKLAGESSIGRESIVNAKSVSEFKNKGLMEILNGSWNDKPSVITEDKEDAYQTYKNFRRNLRTGYWEQLINNKWSIIGYKKKQEKPKKEKQPFDGDESIYISDSGKKMFRACDMDAQAQSIFYQIATQADINKFFKGTKKRKAKQYEYFKETKRALNNNKIDERFYKKEINSISSSIEITEQEYLEGLK